MAAGRADFGIGDPTFVALGAEKGHKTKVVAALVTNCSTWAVTHLPEVHEMKDLNDFVALRFGTYPEPSTSYALISHIQNRSQKLLSSMEIVEKKVGKLTAALAAGEIDIMLEIEPMISIAEEQGLRVVFSADNFFPSLLFTGVSASEQVLEKRPELVSRFVEAIQQGLNACHRNPEMLLSVAHELFPAVSDECMSRAIERMLSVNAWPEQALVRIEDWQNALELRQDIGALKKVKAPGELLEQRFAYEAITSMT